MPEHDDDGDVGDEPDEIDSGTAGAIDSEIDDDDDDDLPPTEPEPVVLPIEEVLDLHSFAPRDILSVVEEYLREARALGLTEVRLIHGRGVGIQRRLIRKSLAKNEAVIAFGDAPPHLGGWGATLVRLASLPPPRDPSR